jgi:hypothetical protein
MRKITWVIDLIVNGHKNKNQELRWHICILSCTQRCNYRCSFILSIFFYRFRYVLDWFRNIGSYDMSNAFRLIVEFGIRSILCTCSTRLCPSSTLTASKQATIKEDDEKI